MASKASILAIMDSNRARLGFGRDRTFVPTPNVRNPHMLQEAEAFSHHLRDFEHAVREYHRRVQGLLRGLLPVLDSNLPRVWLSVDEASGLAEPVRPAISHGHPSRVGGDYNGEELHRHLDRLDRSLQEDVLLPLKRWQEGLAVAKERMNSLERLRREVDGQRRKAEKKFSRAEAKLRKSYLGAGYGSSSSSDDDDDDIVPKGRLLEDYHRLALHTERQLRALLESYEDQERLVWEQLSGLVTDAAWLESYAAATMLKVKEAFQGVAVALGPSKQPLPAYRSSVYQEATGGRTRYGDIGDNLPLIAQMSPRAVELARGSTPRGAHVLPYQPLRAKRGLATPLLVAAAAPPGSRQRQLAQEPVPHVDVGAAGVPLQALPAPVRERALREVEERISGEPAVSSYAGSMMGPPGAASPRVSMDTTPTTPGASAPTSFRATSTSPINMDRTALISSRPAAAAPAYTSTLSPPESRGVTAAAAAQGSEMMGESVRAAAVGGEPAAFTREQQGVEQLQPVNERLGDRGFGSTSLVEEEGVGRERVRAAGGAIDREGFGRGSDPAVDDVTDSYVPSARETAAEAALGGGTAVRGGRTMEGQQYSAGTYPAVNGAPAGGFREGVTAGEGAGLGGAAPRVSDAGTDNTAAAVAQPSSYAISYISSTGSRPETPGGSTITDAIRAEIARGSTGTQPPSAAAATTVPPAGGYASGLRPAGAAGTTGDAVAGGTTGDTLRPLGGTASDEGDEFVDARSEMSTRASSLASSYEARPGGAGAPYSPVQQPRGMLGLSKQQQMQQLSGREGLVQ